MQKAKPASGQENTKNDMVKPEILRAIGGDKQSRYKCDNLIQKYQYSSEHIIPVNPDL